MKIFLSFNYQTFVFFGIFIKEKTNTLHFLFQNKEEEETNKLYENNLNS